MIGWRRQASWTVSLLAHLTYKGRLLALTSLLGIYGIVNTSLTALEKHAAANGVHIKYEKGNSNYGNSNGNRGGTQRGRKLSMNDLNWYGDYPSLSDNNHRQPVRRGMGSQSSAPSAPSPLVVAKGEWVKKAKTSPSIANGLTKALQNKRRGGVKQE